MKDKKFLRAIIVLLVVVSMFFVFTSVKNAAGINLDGFGEEVTDGGNSSEGEVIQDESTKEPTPTATKVVEPTTTKASTKSTENNKDIPHTGSNTEVIFISGMAVLIVASVVIYKKTKI